MFYNVTFHRMSHFGSSKHSSILWGFALFLKKPSHPQPKAPEQDPGIRSISPQALAVCVSRFLIHQLNSTKLHLFVASKKKDKSFSAVASAGLGWGGWQIHQVKDWPSWMQPTTTNNKSGSEKVIYNRIYWIKLSYLYLHCISLV